MAGLFESRFQRYRVCWRVCWRVCLRAVFSVIVSVGGSVGGSVGEPFSALPCLLACLLAGLFDSCFQHHRVCYRVCWRVCLTAVFTAKGHLPLIEKAVVFDDTLFADSSRMRPLRRPPPDISASRCLFFRYPVWLSGSINFRVRKEDFNVVIFDVKGISVSQRAPQMGHLSCAGRTVCSRFPMDKVRKPLQNLIRDQIIHW